MTERKPMMAGNWKMNHTHLEAIQGVQKLSYRLDDTDYDRVDVVVCPAFTSLRSVQTTIDGDKLKISLGAQNCYWEPSGAYTGEVSAPMLAKLNVKYVIAGHSERRELFGETNEMVAKKLRAILASGMIPIVCCGETLEERDAGQTDDKVRAQIESALDGLPETEAQKCVIAYEPIWAIGTGRTASPDEANATIKVIRDHIRIGLGDGVADAVRVLYGGSVKPGNIAELMAMPEIDGGLVGGACLDADEFARIIRYGTT